MSPKTTVAAEQRLSGISSATPTAFDEEFRGMQRLLEGLASCECRDLSQCATLLRACPGPGERRTLSPAGLRMTARFVDLSHTVENDMVTYPGLPPPRISDHLTRETSRSHYASGTEFHIGRIDMVANTGTYLDTPFHRYPDGDDLADLPLEAVANLPGVCVAAAPEGPIKSETLPDTGLTGAAVLLATGWDRHWRTAVYGGGHHPFLAEAAVEKLVAAGVALVGIDAVNIDNTNGGERPAHTRLWPRACRWLST